MKKILFFASVCAVSTFLASKNGTETKENQDARARLKQYCVYEGDPDKDCILGEGPFCIANIVNGKCEDLEIKP